MKKLINKFKNNRLIKWIILQYNGLWNSFHFWNCKRKADKYHKLTGKRYLVIPTEKKLIIVNNDWLKNYNLQVPKQNRMNFKQVIEMSYYSTSAGTLAAR